MDGSVVSYLGCYHDDPGNPDMSVLTGLPGYRMTPWDCEIQCINMGMLYYSLQNGYQ